MSHDQTIESVELQRDNALAALDGARSVVRGLLAERNELSVVVAETATQLASMRSLVMGDAGAAIDDTLDILARAKRIEPVTAEMTTPSLECNEVRGPEL